jgi:hypothetical protein
MIHSYCSCRPSGTVGEAGIELGTAALQSGVTQLPLTTEPPHPQEPPHTPYTVIFHNFQYTVKNHIYTYK